MESGKTLANWRDDMACIDVHISVEDDYSVEEIFQILDRLNEHLRKEDIGIDSVSADWIDEESGDINYFTP